MLTHVKLISSTGLAVAIMGLASLAGVGTAQAAGCLQPGQTTYSLVDSDDNDAALEANAGGFRCDDGGNVLSYAAPTQTVFDIEIFASEPAPARAPRVLLNDVPAESLLSNGDDE